MAIVETRIVRKFRFEMPDDAAEQLMRTCTEDPENMLNENGMLPDPYIDACEIAYDAFNRWNASEDAHTPFCWDEVAGCVLGEDVLHSFEIVPESALNDGTTIVNSDGSII